MLNFFKNDYARVHTAIKLLTDGKAPDWAIAIWYFLILPFGIVLTPFALVFKFYILWKIKKEMKALE